MKLKKILLILFAVTAFSLFAVPVRWTVDVSQIRDKHIEALRGETLHLKAQLTDKAVPVDMTNASAQFFWQTNGMDVAWWQAPATVSASGLLEATFDSSMDCGAKQYRFFIGVTAVDDINYRAGGVISLHSSPGASPTTVDLKVAQTINFAQIKVVNAPWLTSSETAIAISAATNALGEQVATSVAAIEGELTSLVDSSILSATNALDIDGKLSLKQDKFTADQMRAVSSGVTTQTVAQVSANLASIATLAELQKSYATEAWVQSQGYLTSHQDLSGYATVDFVAAAINGIQFPTTDLSGYATEAWVQSQGYLTSHQDLTPYATKDYVDESIDGIELPTPDLSGYATEAWVQGQGYLTSHQDLTRYATVDFVAAAINGIQFPSPDMTGYATENWVQSQGYLTSHQDLSNYATHGYVDSVVARLTDSPDAGSVTRLYSLDGERYIDGTGGVWRAEARYAWLEDGYQVPFEPTDDPTRWVNPQTGGEMVLQDAIENRWLITVPVPTNWVASGFAGVSVNLPSDDNGETIYFEHLFDFAWLQYTNVVMTLRRVDYPGFWWHPVDRLAHESEVRKLEDLLVPGPVAYYCDADGLFYVQSANSPNYYCAPNGMWLDYGYPSSDYEGSSQWRACYELVTQSYYISGESGLDNPSADLITFEGYGTFTRTNVFDRLVVESTMTNYYNRSEVDKLFESIPSGGGTNSSGGITVETDPTVSDWAKEDTKPTYTASEVGAPSTNEFEELKKETTVTYQLFAGSNIVAEVTNYNSAVHAPTLRLMRLGEDGKYNVVWTETNGLERVRKWSASNTLAQVSALDAKVEKTYAPRAWSKTTSALGADAPEETTWISTPTTVFAGGLEFQKTLTSSGQLWFLRANGMTSVSTNRYGILDISSADGTSIFTIKKTDSYLVGVDADSISVSGNTVTMTLSVVSESHPFVRYTPSLSPKAWEKEEDGFTSPIDVVWSGSSGAWVCTVSTSAPAGFFMFEFLQEGSTLIQNGGVMDVSSGILCTDGVHKCRPVYQADGSVEWEVFQ